MASRLDRLDNLLAVSLRDGCLVLVEGGEVIGVWQRLRNDCGVAALATLLNVDYEKVENSWRSALGRKPGSSHYKDLLKVLSHMGVDAKKVTSTKKGIRRVRYEPGSNHSHWVVMLGDDGLWCPFSGWHKTIDTYDMPHLGHGIELL